MARTASDYFASKLGGKPGSVRVTVEEKSDRTYKADLHEALVEGIVVKHAWMGDYMARFIPWDAVKSIVIKE